ncbi:MAG: hypothetical protein LBP64_04960 [Tannerella sp.]|jgi:hypothetical protein|nr:hypothetical protein [Tannerella sp.]
MKNIIFTIVSLLLSISLSAQITFTESKPPQKKVEEPGWSYLKDTYLAPYDSTYIYMKPYPLFEPYKKYIGQQLFSAESGYTVWDTNGELIGIGEKNKYYEIIDVISHAEMSKRNPKNDFGERCNFRYPHKLGGSHPCDVPIDSLPWFLLLEKDKVDQYLY